MNQPVIYSINGPVVKIRNTDVFSMMEMVYVGKRRLIGEVIGLTDTETTIQVYESTSGLQTGARRTDRSSDVCHTRSRHPHEYL